VEAQAPGLTAKLTMVRTPRDSAGYHVWFRCSAVPTAGNMKLAQEPYTDPETGKIHRRTLIETRGEGGYALAPGSPAACHETGRTYDHFSGPPLTELSDITAAEREILIATARSFDLAAAAKTKSPSAGEKSDATGLRPGDDFDARGPDWAEILEPHGWECMSTNGDVRYWRRPGKDVPGHSATTGYCQGANGRDLLAVFSNNADPFDGPSDTRPCSCYTKFAAYTYLNHDGDFRAAAQELRRHGYGDPRQQQNGRLRASEPDRRSETGQANAGVLELDDDPHRLARLFLRDHMNPAGLTLRYWHEEWHAWDGSAYRKQAEGELRARLVNKIKAEFDAIASAKYAEWLAQNMEQSGKSAAPKAQIVTTQLIANVVQALKSMALLPSFVSSPSWIDSPAGFEVASFSAPFAASEVLATRSTLIHLPSLADIGQDFEIPPTPAFFSAGALDYDFDLQAPEPALWLEFLNRLWPTDPQAIKTLQEWFGYCLL
jgi:Bifunctional DNA primase/polymerase, N-terminal